MIIHKRSFFKFLTLSNSPHCNFSTSTHNIQQILQKYYKKNQLLAGYATQKSTFKYSQQFISHNNRVNQSFYSTVQNSRQHQFQKDKKLFISSLGIGTQNGEPTPQDDYKSTEVLVQAMTNGINYIDTDINFRYGKSQKIINAVLNYLIKQCNYERNQFFISTKLGYIPTDVDSDLNPDKLIEILIKQKYIQQEHIVQNIYGWGEGFIDFCVEKSRLSLGVETIDNLFLNNFSEAQMALIPKSQFMDRLKITFKKLQQVRESDRIRNYGICSFVGFRSPPDQLDVHLNLQKICDLVKDAAGVNNGLKYIMLPVNLGMPQALLKWQKYIEKNEQNHLKLFDVAEKENLKVIICSPLFQGRVANLPFSSPKLNYLNTHAAKHLQFIRSINSSALVSTVFGTSNINHLRQDLQVLKHPKVTQQDWKSVLSIPQ